MLNEITCLERWAVIYIDCRTCGLKYELTDYHENTLDPDSPEGMAVIVKLKKGMLFYESR